MSANTNRRRFLYSAALGMITGTVSAKSAIGITPSLTNDDLFYRYPAMSDDLVSEMVGAAHARFDRVKELVEARPELANATWDWGFGDIESALGAAAHMGRRDIADLLMKHGARADIFTYAMLGELEVVKAMIAASPGIQQKLGPHGITLLEHAQSRLRFTDAPKEEQEKTAAMIAYLEELGDAHFPDVNMPITAEEQEVYIGDYRWGEGEDEFFYVSLNRRGLLQIGRQGTFGRALNRVAEHVFTPDGAGSVRIDFAVENSKAYAVTVVEHNYVLAAQRM